MLSLGAGEGYWLGASDEGSDGFWVIEDGGNTYTGPFADGEPSKNPEFNCLTILSGKTNGRLEPGSKLCYEKGAETNRETSGASFDASFIFSRLWSDLRQDSVHRSVPLDTGTPDGSPGEHDSAPGRRFHPG